MEWLPILISCGSLLCSVLIVSMTKKRDGQTDINKEIKADMDKLIKEGIDSSEINRINKYKLHLIYKTPDDLNDRFCLLYTSDAADE